MKKSFLTILLCCIATCFCLSQNFSSSNLPIVIISSGGQPIDAAYTPTFIVWMGVIDNGDYRNHLGDAYTYQGLIKMSVHGNSTQWFPKKAWNITTIDANHNNLDYPLMGLPTEHDWVFKALYQDKTLLRDQLSFTIGQGMGHYASHNRFFELVVDGDYRGVYEIEEKIKRDKNRVNIAKLKPTETGGDSLTGGYIVSVDRLKPGEEGWSSKYPSSQAGDSGNTYIYQYPKPDSMPQVQKDYIRAVFDKFEDVMQSSYWNDKDSGYVKYINVRSFVDKFIIEELSRNTDGYRLKGFFYKDKDSKDPKIHAGPFWGYDIAWDNCSFSGGSNPWWWQYSQNYADDYVPFYWKKLLTDNDFKDSLRCRWQYLRVSVLNKNNLYAHIDSMVNYLSEAEPRNFQRWPILGQYVWPNPQPVPTDYPGEIGQLKWWINERLNWLDSYMPGNCNNNTASIIELANEMKLNAYPNPFSNDFTIAYTISSVNNNSGRAKIKIDLYNLLGEKISFETADKTAGSYVERYTTEQLTPGMYTLKVNIDNKVYSKKLVKVE